MSHGDACVRGAATRGGSGDAPAASAACVDCGTDITARLRLAPNTLRCTPCQSLAERRGHLGRGA